MWPCSSERSAACSLGAVAGADAALIAGEAWWAEAAGTVNAKPAPRAKAQATVSDFMMCLLVVYRGMRCADHGAFAHIVNLYMCKASTHWERLVESRSFAVLSPGRLLRYPQRLARAAAIRRDRKTRASGNAAWHRATRRGARQDR